jgi:hypothetical protein
MRTEARELVLAEADAVDTGLLTEAELMQILDAALRGTGRPCTEAELQRAADWAHTARVEATLLELVLRGDVEIRVDRPELEFRAVA